MVDNEEREQTKNSVQPFIGICPLCDASWVGQLVLNCIVANKLSTCK